MKVIGQLERAQLENTTPGFLPGPASTGRIYADITTPSAAIPKFYNGSNWLNLAAYDVSGNLSTSGVPINSSSPTPGLSIYGADASVKTIANTSGFGFPLGNFATSGLLIIEDVNSQKSCLAFITNLGTIITILSDPSSFYSTTAGAGKIGLAMSGGNLTITNNATGSSIGMKLIYLKNL